MNQLLNHFKGNITILADKQLSESVVTMKTCDKCYLDAVKKIFQRWAMLCADLIPMAEIRQQQRQNCRNSPL